MSARMLGIAVALVLAGAAGTTARAGDTGYPKECGYAVTYVGYSMNARTSCRLVNAANNVLASRTLRSRVWFKIKARGYLFKCYAWGGFDGLGHVTCRNRTRGFYMRFEASS